MVVGDAERGPPAPAVEAYPHARQGRADRPTGPLRLTHFRLVPSPRGW